MGMSNAGFILQQDRLKEVDRYSKEVAKKARNALAGTAKAGAADAWRTIFKLDPNDVDRASDNIGATARILADNIALDKNSAPDL